GTVVDGSLGACPVERGVAALAEEATNIVQSLALNIDDAPGGRNRAVSRADGDVVPGHRRGDGHAHLVPDRLDGLGIGACRLDGAADAAGRVKAVGTPRTERIITAGGGVGIEAAPPGLWGSGLVPGARR